MKVTTFTFLKHKTYLFSFIVLTLVSILSAPRAYSQVDGNYGASKSGLRLGFGAGVTTLHSNWSSNPLGGAAVINLEYDLTPYFTVGVQGQFGSLKGVDADNKFYWQQTAVVYGSGTFNIKVALGQFSDFTAASTFDDIMKKLYIGVGAGIVNSNVQLTPHYDGKGLPSDNIPGLAVAAYLSKPKQNSSNKFTENGSVAVVPLNLGTNIALRGIFGINKVELNPNLQYNLVLSPVFDGYQPNTDESSIAHVNGNQAYFVGSIMLRYKF